MSQLTHSVIDFENFYNIIAGRRRGANFTYHAISPVTKLPLKDAPIATRRDLDDAVIAAQKACEVWAKAPFELRAQLLLHLKNALQAHESDLAELLAEETGRLHATAYMEIKSAYSSLTRHSKLSLPQDTLKDDFKETTMKYFPLGVVAGICPPRYPVLHAVGKIAPALLAGNCIIIRPDTNTPYTTLKVVEIAQRVIGPGVLQAVGGTRDVGHWITNHQDIAKVSFTGSMPSGKKLMEVCTRILTRLSYELGGNDAIIVCQDVDIEKITRELAHAAFMTRALDICITTDHVYVHSSILEPVMTALTEMMRSVKPEALKSDGTMEPCQSWEDEDEIIKRVNSTKSDLGVCVFSKDVDAALRIAKQLEAGSVSINGFEGPRPRGLSRTVKQRWIGGDWIMNGLLSYCHVQAIHVYDGPSGHLAAL